MPSRRGGWRPVRTRQASAATSLAAQGEPMLWLAGGALAVALTMIVGLLVLVLYQGLLTFWPQPVVQARQPTTARFTSAKSPTAATTPPQQHMLAVLPHATADRATHEAAEARRPVRAGQNPRRKLRADQHALRLDRLLPGPRDDVSRVGLGRRTADQRPVLRPAGRVSRRWPGSGHRPRPTCGPNTSSSTPRCARGGSSA